MSSIARLKSSPRMETDVLGEYVEARSLDVRRPVPQPRSRILMAVVDGKALVTCDRKLGRRLDSSDESIAWSMFPSVS